MSVVYVDKQLVHYELLGRGRPIIFLHSWLGSWRSWMPSMEAVSDRYRTLAFDFWGFGDSAPPRDDITIERYVDQLNGFVEVLGIQTPHLVGHGLGGLIAVRAASTQAARYGKVLITATPIVGTVLQPAPQTGSIGRLFGRGARGNEQWLKLVRQVIGGTNGASNFSEILEDIEATDPQVVNQVLAAITDVDLRSDLARLQQPLLAIYGKGDTILPAAHSAAIKDVAGRFRQLLIFEQSGHFPFLDQSNQFTRALLQFFTDEDQVVELKAEWRRRVSQREFL
ncbi:MAG: alpha/beta hydrolase [Herpetosiphonaceae bacterium]|nr:alpha/beta hydrolase [Herpetosiphonaceae bacterium]